MPLIEGIDGLSVELQAASIRIPLQPIFDARDARRAAAEKPCAEPDDGIDVDAPSVGKTFAPMPMKRLALRELIALAGSGEVEVALPLPRTSIGNAVFKVDLSRGHCAVIQLVVDDGVISRCETSGAIEPPIELPLGATFLGLRVDDDGNVVAEIDGFIDLNLSRWSSAVPRIPETLDELLPLIFDRPKKASSDGSKKLDLTGLRVAARQIVPHGASTLSLGELGRATLTQATRLTIDYTHERLRVVGRAAIEDATFEGEGFVLRDVSGQCDVSFTMAGPREARTIAVKLGDLDLQVGNGAIAMRNGTRLSLGACTLDDGDIDLTIRPDRTREISAVLRHVSGKIESGAIVFAVEGKRSEFVLKPATIDGAVTFAKPRLELELEVAADGLALPEFAVDLGVTKLALQDVGVRGKGQVKGNLETGFAFTGDVDAVANMAGTRLKLDGIVGTLVQGSRATAEVTEFFVSRTGLESVTANGRVAISMRGGSMPLGTGAVLAFERGAAGVLDLRDVHFAREARFPFVQGGLRIEALSDPLTVGSALRLPEGHGRVDLEVQLDSRGLLRLEEIGVRFAIAGSGATTEADGEAEAAESDVDTEEGDA